MKHRNPLSPPEFPARWASDWGEDRHGLWMAFTYKNVRQVMRWIVPGRFMMGSPEGEKGRLDREVLHSVTLTEGFWLADTPTTQALWEAVTKDNPSSFKGENLPVEQVSWDDTQTFIQSFNELNPELSIRLPTEAEWEYACRAGTDGAFHFGYGIDLNKANYNGSWDDWTMADNAVKQTSAVKSYACNDWGLYDCHGNVWEWCQDGWGDYKAGAVSDPQGPETGEQRVLRGGSWYLNGGYCRSASRLSFTPAGRHYNFGFRFALGH